MVPKLDTIIVTSFSMQKFYVFCIINHRYSITLYYQSSYFLQTINIKSKGEGFPDGSLVRNPPVNAGGVGSVSGLGRSHVPWSTQACAPQLPSLCPRAGESQPLTSCAAVTKAQAT